MNAADEHVPGPTGTPALGGGRVTQRDVARRFGCHRSTVSLALSGHPSIPSDVRERICALAQEMGYRADPSLAMLARNRFSPRTPAVRGALAYLVHSREPCYRSHQLAHFHSARRRAEACGYRLDEFDLAEYPRGRAASNVLYSRGVQGILVPRMPSRVQAYLEGWRWEQFAIVCCSVGWAKLPFHTVQNRVFDGFRLLWREAISRGYQRIGGAVFCHDPVAEDDHARYGASLAEQHERLPPRQRLPLLRCCPSDRAAFLAWVKRHRPDALVSFLSCTYGWLVAAGYRVPEDLGFACGGIRPCEPYSGLALRNDDLGRAAVDWLIELIHANQRDIPAVRRTLGLEPRWVEGNTLPRVEQWDARRVEFDGRVSQISELAELSVFPG